MAAIVSESVKEHTHPQSQTAPETDAPRVREAPLKGLSLFSRLIQGPLPLLQLQGKIHFPSLGEPVTTPHVTSPLTQPRNSIPTGVGLNGLGFVM